MGMFDGIGSALLGKVQQAKDKAKGLMFKQQEPINMAFGGPVFDPASMRGIQQAADAKRAAQAAQQVQAQQQVQSQAAGINDIVNAQSPTQMGQYQASNYANSGSSVGGLQSSAAKLGYMQANEANKELERLRPQQLAFANQLAAGALGQGPSLAEAQMKMTNERTLAQQLGAAKSARNVNPALAQRNIGNIAAQQNSALAQNTAMAKMQEQQQKQQMFNQYLQQQNQGVLQGASTGSSAAAQSGATRQAGQNSTNAMIGAGLGGVASVLAGPAGGALFGKATEKTPGMAHGGMVPGPEYFKGDSLQNDTVPAMLSPGEIVVPKSIVEGGKKDIMSFIEKIAQDKQKAPTEPKNKKGFESVVKAVKGGK